MLLIHIWQRNPHSRKLEVAFGCAWLTVPKAKQQEPCSAEDCSCSERQRPSAPELGVKSRACGQAITYSMEEWKEAAHWEHPKIPMYHHPKESKEEIAVALPAPQVPFCWAEIQRAWQEVLMWIQAVWEGTLPSRFSSKDNKAIIRPYIPGALLGSSVFSEKLLIFGSVAWKCVFTLNLSSDLHGSVGARLELPVCWKKFLPLMSCSIKENIQKQNKKKTRKDTLSITKCLHWPELRHTKKAKNPKPKVLKMMGS